MKPHVDIGPGYLHRWHLIPRNPIFNIYLHKFMHDDHDRALHDHPWHSVSVLLKGRLREVLKQKIPAPGEAPIVQRSRCPRWLVPVFRKAKTAHRLEVVTPTAWTLFLTGPRIRVWGFHIGKGRWLPFYKYLDPNDTTRSKGIKK